LSFSSVRTSRPYDNGDFDPFVGRASIVPKLAAMQILLLASEARVATLVAWDKNMGEKNLSLWS
jgi:hypothetical protein